MSTPPEPIQPSRRHTPSGMVLQPRRLRQVLLSALAGVGMGMVVALARGNGVVAGALLIGMGLLVASLKLVQRGRVDHAASLMLGSLTLLVCWLVFNSEGTHDEAVVAFPGILIFASMFGTRRLFVALLIMVSLVLCAIVLANAMDWHQNPVESSGWGTLVNLLGIIWITAFFVWLMASDLRQALQRLEAENVRIRESHAQIEILAHHDTLTGLPNRVLARDRLAQIIAHARRQGSVAAVMYLDLDNFKTVNDSLGHAAGDMLLCGVAERLAKCVRESDTVSRQGGDEFLVLLDNVSEEVASATAVKIIDELATPFMLNGMEISASFSMGIAMYPEDGPDFDALLKNSDIAMYRAKDAGRNTFRFFDASMNNSVLENLHLTTGIRAALFNREFVLHYQPQFELASGRIIGAEALIRWTHPSLGFIPPAKFIPVAERSGLINEIGAWVLNEACRQAKLWQEKGLEDLVIAVNVSPVQFRRDDIEREVANALAASNLTASSIELELTESLLIADSSHLDGVLARLRGMGIRFSIDDFGTGYSNLGYLKRFEVERLKIDQSFVRRMTENDHDLGIVQAVIAMARSLKLQAVAEGVEDAKALSQLQALGCEYGQGFHWSPALAPDAFEAFVRARRSV